MSQSVGLGLLGCGDISALHLRETQHDPRVRWVAACDVRAEAAAARADEFGIAARYTDYHDLLTDPAVDAVVVATPPVFHLAPVLASFGAGKHVLVEKPVGITVAEVEAMLAAQPVGLVGASCSCRFRSNAAARLAAAAVADGRLGRLRRLVARVVYPASPGYNGTSPFFLHRPNWGGQGVLADWGVYDLDYLLGLAGWGHPPVRIQADLVRLPPTYRAIAAPRNDVEVQVTAYGELADGVVFDYRRAAFYAGEPHNEWRLEGDDAALDLCLLPGTPQVVLHRLTGDGAAEEVLAPTAYTWSEIHAGPVLDFVGAILEDRPPLTSLQQALEIQQLTDAIYDAGAR
ncbi:MAG: Gfo/Idh/MocA family oxidoreductase [Fimbriimonadaceae bacterium]|nr:Gfo/Idh/MocA family oxidoreductase [Fimbriimonadaceae bacterium]